MLFYVLLLFSFQGGMGTAVVGSNQYYTADTWLLFQMSYY